MVQTSGSLTLRIEDKTANDFKDIVLNGQIGNQIQVGFRASDDFPEIALGTFEGIITSVASALGLGSTNFAEKFKSLIEEIGKVSTQMATIAAKLLSAQLYITDLALSAQYDETTESYKVTNAAFGFRVEFEELKIGPVQIVGFGVLFEYNVDETGNGGNGTLTQSSKPAKSSKKR